LYESQFIVLAGSLESWLGKSAKRAKVEFLPDFGLDAGNRRMVRQATEMLTPCNATAFPAIHWPIGKCLHVP
jgi:hypothetical protein